MSNSKQSKLFVPEWVKTTLAFTMYALIVVPPVIKAVSEVPPKAPQVFAPKEPKVIILTPAPEQTPSTEMPVIIEEPTQIEEPAPVHTVTINPADWIIKKVTVEDGSGS